MAIFYRLLERKSWLFRVYALYLRTLHVIRGVGYSDQHDLIWDEIVTARFPVGTNLYYTFRTYRFTSRTYRIPLLPGKKFYLFFAKRDGRPFWDDCTLKLGPLLEVAIRWKGQYDRRFAHVLFLPRQERSRLRAFGTGTRGKFEFIHELLYLEHDKLSVSCWWWGGGWMHSCFPDQIPDRLYRRLGPIWRFGKVLTSEERREAIRLHDSDKTPEFRKRWIKDALTGRWRNLEKELYPDQCIECGGEYNSAHHSCTWNNPSRCDDCYAKHIDHLDIEVVA